MLNDQLLQSLLPWEMFEDQGCDIGKGADEGGEVEGSEMGVRTEDDVELGGAGMFRQLQIG